MLYEVITTKIYSMAGGEEKPTASREELIAMIKELNLVPAERDTFYNILEIW